MGHKVNATSLRIRNIWDSLWYFKDLKKNKKFYFNQDNLIKNYIKHINLNQNKIVFDIFIFRNLQNLVIFFKVFEFQKKLVKKKTFSKKTTKKKNTLQRLFFYKHLPTIFSTKSHIEFYLNKFFSNFNIKLIEKKINFDNSLFYDKSKKKNYRNIKGTNLYLFKILNMGFVECSSELIAVSIAKFLPLTKNNYKFFKFVKKNMFQLFERYKLSCIKGYRIEVNGCFNGRDRTKKIFFGNGPMPLSTINANIDYSFKHIYTKHGTFGIKVWLFLYNTKHYDIKRIFDFNKFLKFHVSPTTVKNYEKKKEEN